MQTVPDPKTSIAMMGIGVVALLMVGAIIWTNL